MKGPEISVGIVNAQEINFSLNMNYSAKGGTYRGEETVSFAEGGILWRGNLYQELTFTPAEEGASFSLYNVTIGINFHWERQETQIFQGTLKLVVEEGKITAINLLPVEDYLISVISSEMKATSPLEFLKAHAVVSRSWLYAQMEKRRSLQSQGEQGGFFSLTKSDTEYVRWYDREDHTIFDVCADDHCQRYQGITKATKEAVVQAVQATRGQVLMHGGEICDARFHKCCGGATEEFETCWEDKHFPYLEALRDTAPDKEKPTLPDLTQEAEAEQWIRSAPRAFCNTQNKRVLAQILNHYDQETTDFYRWQVRYTQEELADLIRRRSKTDYGQILDLIPVQRGKSGRITRLQIVGTKRTMCIGKELEIRRTLSESHLFSSAFVVDKEYPHPPTAPTDTIATTAPIGTIGTIAPIGTINTIPPTAFTLTGAGWGHGVGLCQIGAAVMGERGYKYDQILLHYFQGAEIKEVYE
ncbi:MAG: SpoIID/LytB domain-containing protein [Bacteroidaceae bacterium]|nr:SpoIID/LytB domain-containing protein [Bacteroidaceae bacterium]